MSTVADQIANLLNRLDQPFGEERDHVYAELREVAAAHPATFTGLIRQLPLDRHTVLFELYEIIGADAVRWSDFLVEEAHRLLEAQGNPVNQTYPRKALEGFYVIEDEAVREQIKLALLRHATSASVQTRRTVAKLLSDYVDEVTDDVRRVLERFSRDPDWRVRVLAQQELNWDQGQPQHANLRLFDRLRLKVQMLYDWK